MKPALKKSIIFIIIFVVILGVTQWILWSHAFGKNTPPHENPTYDSLEQYTKENSNSETLCKIIAQDDKYAVSYKAGDGYAGLADIFSKNENGKWQLLSEDYDYEIKYYSNKNINRDFNYIYIFTLLNSEKKIIIIDKAVNSTTIGEYVPNEKIEKLKSISDSQNTIFYFAAEPSKTIHAIYTYYVGFVDNFDKNTYALYINDKEYPFKDWKKLLK